MLDRNNLLGWHPKTPQNSMIRLQASLGTGSNNTRTWTNVIASIGNDIQYNKNAALGDTLVAVSEGMYSIVYTDTFGAASYVGISLNGDPATSVVSLPQASILAASYQPNANEPITVVATVFLKAGDTIRAHCQTLGPGSNAFSQTFVMVKLSP